MGKVRVRQHVNPLRVEYQTPLGAVDWAAAFEDPSLPLVVDLGCGSGRFLLLLQRRAAESAAGAGAGVPQGGRCNFLGVEIRRAVRGGGGAAGSGGGMRRARTRALVHTHTPTPPHTHTPPPPPPPGRSWWTAPTSGRSSWASTAACTTYSQTPPSPSRACWRTTQGL